MALGLAAPKRRFRRQFVPGLSIHVCTGGKACREPHKVRDAELLYNGLVPGGGLNPHWRFAI